VEGTIKSTFFQQGAMHVVCWNTITSVYDIWIFDAGLQGSNYFLQYTWNALNGDLSLKEIKSLIHEIYTSDVSLMTVRLFINDDMTSGTSVNYNINTQANKTTFYGWNNPNISEVKTLSIQIQGAGFKHRFYNHEIEYLTRRIKS
jgi:hypothetical protein